MPNTLKIRQAAGLMILCSYFTIKILSIGISFVFGGGTLYSKQKYHYLLDAGHGFVGDNCIGVAKSVVEEDGECFWEWKFNNSVRQYLVEMLDNDGIKYTLLNPDIEQTDMPLKVRTQKANVISKKKKCVLISIHANAGNSKKANMEKAEGFEVFSPKEEDLMAGAYLDKKEFSDSLAQWLMDFIKKDFPEHEMRSTNSENDISEHDTKLAIISNTICYSILSENEFFTNPSIRRLLKTTDFQKRCAAAHYKLIKKIENE